MLRTLRTPAVSAILALLVVGLLAPQVWAQTADPTATALDRLTAAVERLAQQQTTPAQPAVVQPTAAVSTLEDRVARLEQRQNAADIRIGDVEAKQTAQGRDLAALKAGSGQQASHQTQPAVSARIRQASTGAATAAPHNGGVPVLASVPGTPAPPVVKKDHAIVLRFSAENPRNEDVAKVLQAKADGYRVETVVWLPPGANQTTREVAYRNHEVWNKRSMALNQAAGMGLTSRIATDAEAKEAPAGTLAYAIMRAP